MSLSTRTTYIGVTESLADFTSHWSYPDVRVSYLDTDGNRQVVNICPAGARTLAKGLKKAADIANPPKPRRKRG